jgi:hypothetical protein
MLLQLNRVEPVYALHEVGYPTWSRSIAASSCTFSCQVAGSTVAKPAGIDAGNGAYGRYLASCGVPSNGSLPTNIQAAVCTTQVDIRTTLYDAMWMDSGAWCVLAWPRAVMFVDL